MRKFTLYALLWYSVRFTGPMAEWDMVEFLNELPNNRAREAKIVQGLQPEQYGLSVTYTIVYRSDSDKPQEDE